ncbi:glycosyltransferase family 4 protein [Nevskia ramosa]|uniref:glycosyltransferase family 4 protein n=1 Tax=Nevskia ramosa TaxID=64002 RepID=UPI003D0D3DBD
MPINSEIAAANTRILSGHTTGVQRYALELLARFGNQVHAVAPTKPRHGVNGHLWEQFVLPSKLDGRLLWSPSNTGPLMIERQIVTLHDVVPIDHPEWLNPRFAAWYQFLTPKLVRRVRSVITDSLATRERILHYFPDVESKIEVVHIGVDQRFHERDASERESARKALGIPSPHYVFALGSLEPRKNLSRLLQAWARIEHRVPDDVWLVLAGARGKKLVFGDVSFESLPPRVHLSGYVPDELLPALYSGAIAAPYLSVYEGFGLPPLEAMACGSPPLTGDRTSLPEVVGDAGVMVDPFDVDAIADGLLRLIENPSLRAQLSARGVVRAKAFTWEKTAAETWSIIERASQR